MRYVPSIVFLEDPLATENMRIIARVLKKEVAEAGLIVAVASLADPDRYVPLLVFL
jgi:hypothetical protein